MPRKPLSNPELTTKEKSRISARDYARRKRLAIQRQPCEVCGDPEAECHHVDYADPDRVAWLCTKRHAQTHSQFGKPAPEWMTDIRAAVKRIDARRLEARAERERRPVPARGGSMLTNPSRGGAAGGPGGSRATPRYAAQFENEPLGLGHTQSQRKYLK
jgi:hypothetical protein